MLLIEFYTEEEVVTEGATVAWARRGSKVVRKYRCTDGPRQGRIVNSPADCTKPVNLKKRQKFKQTLRAKGKRIARKALRTKTKNPASLRVQRMNKG